MTSPDPRDPTPLRDYHTRPSTRWSARVGGWCLLAAVIILLIATLSGCAVKISTTERAPNWPQLKPVVITVAPATLHEVCSGFGSALQTHEACSLPLFSARLCLVFVDPATMNGRVPGDNATRLEHELLHCAGHEHVGRREAEQLLAGHRLWEQFVVWRAAACTGQPPAGPPDLVAAFQAWAKLDGCGRDA